MTKSKFYAVRKGRQPGIYTTWEECAAQVSGFAGAVFKSFAERKDALAFMQSAPAQGIEAAPSGEQPVLFEQPKIPAPAPIRRVNTAGLPEVIAYTDGGCLYNPGPGGYGVVLLANGARRELSGGFRLTTNNRMELTACIVALEAIHTRSAVTVYSDSRYLVNAVEKDWVLRWQRQNWMRKEGKVPNADLWQRLLRLLEHHEVDFEWVRGHAGNPENERCDQLAMAALKAPHLPPDEGYEGER